MKKIERIKTSNRTLVTELPSHPETCEFAEFTLKSTETKRQQQQKQLIFDNHKNKCRCCFNEFTENGTKINEWHRELFRLVINVELRSDLRLSEKICSECNEKMKNLTEFTQTLSETQKKFCDSVDNVDIDVSVEDEIDIEVNFQDETEESQNLIYNEGKVEAQFMAQGILSEPLKSITLKQCFVRIERLDETTMKKIEMRNSKKLNRRLKLRLPSLLEEVFVCDLCYFWTETKERIHSHMLLKHETKKSQCSICNEFYDNALKLKIHKRLIHSHKFKCLICPQKRSNYSRFVRHVNEDHPKEKSKIISLSFVIFVVKKFI